MGVELRDYPECEITTWRPVLEPDFAQERFLTDDPVKLFKSGNFAKVKVLAGIVTDEFINLVPSK